MDLKGPNGYGTVKFGFEKDNSQNDGKVRLRCMPTYLCMRYDMIVMEGFDKVQAQVKELEHGK